MLGVREKLFNCSYGGRDVWSGNDLPEFTAPRVSFHRRKIFLNGLLVGLAMSSWQVKAQGVKIESLFLSGNPTLLETFQFGREEQFNRVRNGIESIKSVSGERLPVTVPQSEPKGDNRPDKRDEGRIGVEKKHEFTQWEILQILFMGAMPAVLLGMASGRYVSPRTIKHYERWMRYHEIKAKRWHRKHPQELYPMPRRTFWQWLWF